MVVESQHLRPVSTAGAPLEIPASAILDEAYMGVLLVDASGKVLYRNRRAQLWTDKGDRIELTFGTATFPTVFPGWNGLLEQITKSGVSSSLECAFQDPRENRPSLLTLQLSPMAAGQAHTTENRRRRTDTAQSHATSQRQQAGCLVVITMVPSTVTRPADERLEVSQRLLSLGKLAARVAHELNNPLDGILRYINLALRLTDNAPEAKLKSYLMESRTGLIRMAQIIGDLLEYSRTSSGEFDAMSINEVVEQAIRNTTANAREKVMIAADFQEENMPIVGGSRLYQVCCNLIRNALDAMPGGGRLAITTGLVDEDVVLRFADTGVGLPDDIGSLFRPFFTTKKPGKGTGLGLAICKEFVEAMHGTISACNGPEGGAVFIVRIPSSGCRRPSPLVHRSVAPQTSPVIAR